MIALAGMRHSLHPAQEGVHFIGTHGPARTDGAMAGDAGQDSLDFRLDGEGAAAVAELVKDIANKRFSIDWPEDGRGSADGNGTGTEGLDLQPEAGQCVGFGEEEGGLGVAEFYDFGDKEGLGRDAIAGRLLFQRLIDEALMGGVLVDEDNPVFGLGDDVGAVQLRARRAQRTFGGLGLGGWDRFSGQSFGGLKQHRGGRWAGPVIW